MLKLTEEQTKKEINIFLRRVEGGDKNVYIANYKDKEYGNMPLSVEFWNHPISGGTYVLVRWLNFGPLFSTKGHWIYAQDSELYEFWDPAGSSKIEEDIVADLRKEASDEVEVKVDEEKLKDEIIALIQSGATAKAVADKYKKDALENIAKDLNVQNYWSKKEETLVENIRDKLKEKVEEKAESA